MEKQYSLLFGTMFALLTRSKFLPHIPYSINFGILFVCQAGADPQCMDSRRNTPLHIIVTYQVLYRYLFLFSDHVCGINVLKITFSWYCQLFSAPGYVVSF
jgi:hypothetical protein